MTFYSVFSFYIEIMNLSDLNNTVQDFFNFFKEFPERKFQMDGKNLKELLSNLRWLLSKCADGIELNNNSSRLVKGGYKNRIGLDNALEQSIVEMGNNVTIDYCSVAEILDLYKICLENPSAQFFSEDDIFQLVLGFTKLGIERETIRFIINHTDLDAE